MVFSSGVLSSVSPLLGVATMFVFLVILVP